jgi:hypothetical protein
MNNHLILNQTQTCEQPQLQIPRMWQVAVSPYTYKDILGNLEDEIAAESAQMPLAVIPAPEIDPDQFETAYLWFLS